MLKPATQNNSHIHHGRHACTHRHSLTLSLTHTHTNKHTHTHTHTHTATPNFIITPYLLILEDHSLIPGQSPSRKYLMALERRLQRLSVLSSTNTVCSRTRPNSFQPGANFLNCHSYKTAHTQIKSLIWLQNSSYLHST